MTGKDTRKRNKANKQSYKQNYLPTDKRTLSDNSPDSSSSETDTKNTSGQSGVANRPPGPTTRNSVLLTIKEIWTKTLPLIPIILSNFSMPKILCQSTRI